MINKIYFDYSINDLSCPQRINALHHTMDQTAFLEYQNGARGESGRKECRMGQSRQAVRSPRLLQLLLLLLSYHVTE